MLLAEPSRADTALAHGSASLCCRAILRHRQKPSREEQAGHLPADVPHKESSYVVTIKCNSCQRKVQGMICGEQHVTQTTPKKLHNDYRVLHLLLSRRLLPVPQYCPAP